MPVLPDNFELKQVDFPPNPMFEQGDNDLEAFRDACRLDKGRRVLAGILEADKTGYVMVVDDDDFVSRRLTGFVAGYPGENGWYVQNGYIWGDGGRLIYEYTDFSKFCGTSHIIRADLYEDVRQSYFHPRTSGGARPAPRTTALCWRRLSYRPCGSPQ